MPRYHARIHAAPPGFMNTAYQPQKEHGKATRAVGNKEQDRRIAALVAREREREKAR